MFVSSAASRLSPASGWPGPADSRAPRKRVNAVPHERDDARPVRPVANLRHREIDGVIRLVLVDRADALDAAVVVAGREGRAEMIRGRDRARHGALLAADGGANFRVDPGPVEVLVEGDDLLLVERFVERGR